MVFERLPNRARVAVIRLRSLGDCVLTTPALDILKTGRPDLRVAVVVEDRFAPVFEGNLAVEALLPPRIPDLRDWQPDLCLNLHGGSRSAALTVASGAKIRAGFAHFRFAQAYTVKIPTAQQILGVDESPGGLFQETLGTEFDRPAGRPVSREESRATVRRLYDGVITTGNIDDVEMLAESYIQNSGWTPDGRAAFASALAISRGAMPDGRALQTQIVAEANRIASRSVWDGTITQSGRAVDFTSLDFFRLEDGLIAEHWETVDWIRVYQSFGLLADDVRDV